LPTGAAQWDCYETDDTGSEWYWNGTSWHEVGLTLQLDAVPTEDSANAVTSGGVYNAIEAATLPITVAPYNAFMTAQTALYLPALPSVDSSNQAATTKFVTDAIAASEPPDLSDYLKKTFITDTGDVPEFIQNVVLNLLMDRNTDGSIYFDFWKLNPAAQYPAVSSVNAGTIPIVTSLLAGLMTPDMLELLNDLESRVAALEGGG
jgi:hypothetical protein